MSKMDIGACIREIRTLEGLSSIELSERVGIDSTTLTKLETGRIKNPAYETVLRIVEILSQTSTVRDNKLDFAKYNEWVGKMFKAFKEMPKLDEQYRNEVLKLRLGYFSDNLNYISAEELELINMFAFGKKIFIESSQSAQNLKNNVNRLVTDGIIEKFEGFNFSNVLSFILDNDLSFRERLNTILSEVVAMNNYSAFSSFLPFVLDHLNTKEAMSFIRKSIKSNEENIINDEEHDEFEDRFSDILGK